MNAIGLGVDIVDVARIGSMLARHPDRFCQRVFTDSERRYADADSRRTERYAARFAAKEAVMKALGAGWGSIGWTDIEVTRSESGAPGIALTGSALRISESLGVRKWLLSLSHTETTAIATAIAIGDPSATI